MADFIIYDHNSTVSGAHPIRGWGIGPDGAETQMASEPEETSVAAPEPVSGLDYDTAYIYDPATDTISQSPIAPSASLVSEQDIRREIDHLLRASDWTQLADAPLADPAPWTAYRAALRAIPQQAQFPDNVTWPVAPADVEF